MLAQRGRAERLMAASEMKLRGRHNLANALAAVAAVTPLGASPDSIRRVLRDYAGLEHRLEPAGSVDGVNSSTTQATNVASLAVALRSFRAPGRVDRRRPQAETRTFSRWRAGARRWRIWC
jgi:UDP-N-acetylmuramoylalanine--D-glutamate ligase